MKLTPVIQQLRSYAPSFRTVAGGLDWDPTEKSINTPLPAAFVIVVGDDAGESQANVTKQDITDDVDVCVVLANKDERGQAAADRLHDLRAELWRALVGFEPDEQSTALQYAGGALLLINRDKVVYRYRFFTEFQLGRNSKDEPPETWQERVLDGLPALEGLDVNYDFIGPLNDKNLSDSGPDGRIEFQTREDLPQ